MEGLGDPFSIAAFASDGREAVRYLQIKPFGAPLDATVGAALAGLTPAFSTRLGAALRHAGASLARQANHRRLVFLLTDGEPSDIDCPDPRYLVEDARRAVLGLEGQGIDVFCVGLGQTNIEIEERIFGRRRTVQISSVADLPEKLAILYLRLTEVSGPPGCSRQAHGDISALRAECHFSFAFTRVVGGHILNWLVTSLTILAKAGD